MIDFDDIKELTTDLILKIRNTYEKVDQTKELNQTERKINELYRMA